MNKIDVIYKVALRWQLRKNYSGGGELITAPELAVAAAN